MENETKVESKKLSIPMAIIIAGFLIAGAVYFSSDKTLNIPTNNNGLAITTLAPVSKEDRVLGNKNAKITLIVYADFQCPYCGAVSGLLKPNSPAIQYLKKIDPTWIPFMSEVNNYIKNGDVKFVYRDWAFLGAESVKSAEAARCAGDQNKFWEYHDYLYSHQNGENEGGFSDSNLKSFAKNLSLDTTTFDQCLDSNKYQQAVTNSKNEGMTAGVTGTPKGFILKNDKIVGTIDGAESGTTVKQKIDTALK
ncbi:MAG: thioredoxin domain-containing protein [Candidatus Paceibacterota bacterium]